MSPYRSNRTARGIPRSFIRPGYAPRYRAGNDALDHATVVRPLHAVRAGMRPRGHDLLELGAREHERGAVVGGPAVRELARRHEPRECRPPLLFAVVVRAGAAGEQAEPVVEGREFVERERIGDGPRKPAVHAGAQAAEHDPLLPGAAQDPVEAVDAPHREQVRGIPAPDVDHVLREHERLEVADRPKEQLEVGRPAVERGERAVEASDGPLGVAAGGREEAHARPGRARERQDELVEQRIVGLHQQPAAAHRHHSRAGHGHTDRSTS